MKNKGQVGDRLFPINTAPYKNALPTKQYLNPLFKRTPISVRNYAPVSRLNSVTRFENTMMKRLFFGGTDEKR